MGANGAQGIQGIQGVPGTDGTVAAYHAAQPSSTHVSLSSSAKQVLSLDLPAGKFLVSANVDASTVVSGAPTGASYIAIACGLNDGSVSDGAFATTGLFDYGDTTYRGSVSMPMQIAVGTTAASTVTLLCDEPKGNTQGGGPSAIDGAINAVQVSSITSSS